MREFVTNSGKLCARIEGDERLVSGETGSGAGGNVDDQVVESPVVDTNVIKEDMNYSRSVLWSAVKDVSGQGIFSNSMELSQ